MAPLLLATALLVSTCGLVYELLAGSLASYLLGDSILQFSTLIGAYLSAMGLGAWMSGHLERAAARRFVEAMLLASLVGGLSAPLLFLAFAHLPNAFRPVLYATIALTGTLVGLEIPLLLRVLKERYAFKELVARVLTFDYVGALLGSLAFPMLLLPRLGMARTGIALGLLNAACALASTFVLAPAIPRVRPLRIQAFGVIAALLGALLFADRLTLLAEDGLYADEIVFARQTPYQRIVLTRGRGSFQLFLNGNLQFSSADEYRYHEALVHPAMSLAPGAKRVLVLGGGDGLAVRELLKYPGLEEIVLVDLDAEMVRIARENPLLLKANKDSLRSPKVKVVNEDAYVWVQRDHGKFDVAIVDFPDPNNFALGKLYTTRFYKMLRRSLAPDAPVAVQSTSPLMARRSFWCVVRTLEDAGFAARPYHAFVPSFGEWGFVLARAQAFEVPTKLQVQDLSWLTEESLPTLFSLGKDMGPLPVEVNRLNNQALVQYYEAEWRRWN
ncbi:MAG TPA: polyamine aminopropyltransferase [Myxococcales bacterium]